MAFRIRRAAPGWFRGYCTVSSGIMDIRNRYQRAQEAAREGRHEEALREYLWFHEHALEIEPSLYGVRLSFALAAWLDLGHAYPPALDALKRVRDEKTRRLLASEGGRELFHDVEAINEHLDDDEATYELFQKLQTVDPELASTCASLAMRAIVQARDYDLASRYIADPEEELRNWSVVLNEDIADLAKEPPQEAPVQDAYVHIYAERVRLLLAILNGVGERARAEAVHKAALESVDSVVVREAVAQAVRHEG